MTTPKILIGSNTMKMVTIMRIIDMYEKWVVKEKKQKSREEYVEEKIAG
jgi:hypothetical protein